MKINHAIRPDDLRPDLDRFWSVSAAKIDALTAHYDDSQGSPVFTVAGKYTARGWTEWTQGFQYGSEILQFEATGEERFLESGRRHTVERMTPHVTHFGVHDHGFNNISTYGNLLRLMREGRIPDDPWERRFHELALKCSGAVQARRWTDLRDGRGYIHSFNGPHSLFADTIRSLRALAVAHRLGHALLGESDARVSLLDRLLTHARTTAEYIVFYGEGRDAYDVPGRVAHEAVFNVANGSFRCPNSQQGFSPFTTWTRGLAWIMLGCAELLEFLEICPDAELEPAGGARVRGDPPAPPRQGHLRLLYRPQCRRRNPLLGHGGAQPAPARRLPGPVGRAGERLGAGGQLRRRHRRPGAAPPWPLPWWLGGRPLPAGRADYRRDLAPRALPEP